MRNNYYDDYYDEYDEYEYERERRRRRRIKEERRRRRRRQVTINRIIFGTVCLVILITVVSIIRGICGFVSNTFFKKEAQEVVVGSDDTEIETEEIEEVEEEIEEPEETVTYEAHLTEGTVTTGDNIISERSVLINKNTGDILMQKGYKDRISPASMTKVLTVLVACENLKEENLSDTFTMTSEITYYAYKNDCSSVGFANDEVVTVKDLLYGTILPSGGDAAVGLATYIAGSHEAFVDMMNDKLAEMGLAGTTHFTNCVGLYDEDHYSTLYDIAMIMEAAVDNPLAKEILTAHTYTTSSTAEHSEGITISNWFLRRIEDNDTGGTVVCAKTGFVVESRNCAVSYGVDRQGNEFVVATQGATSGWRCIYDHVRIYKQFEGNVNNGPQEVKKISGGSNDVSEEESSENAN